MSGENLDAIIFGASGFTGKVVVEDAVEFLKDFKWGIAGRNESKLKDVLETVGERLKTDLSHIPVILADVNDVKSLETMAKRCKIVLNCCGPFRLYGEVVVKACIDAGTHHVDISGEQQYADSIQLKYHALAQQRGSYVIPTCGFESVLAEMAVLYSQQKFPGHVNSVELFCETKLNYKDHSSKAVLHSGTWDSIVHYMQHVREIFALQKELNTERIQNPLKPKLRLNPFVHKTAGLDSYFIALPTVARHMVQRSQRLFYNYEYKRPVQIHTYIGFQSRSWALLLQILMIFGLILSQFDFTRKILLKYPQIFTGGYMTRQGPLEANRKASEFVYTLKTMGWYLTTPQTADPTTEMIVRVSGKDHYYGLTSKILLLCAKVILKEHDKMPLNGGVLPPGVAFAKTKLLEEISGGNIGLKFEVLTTLPERIEYQE